MTRMTIERFSGRARVAHWSTTVLFFIVAATGATLFFPALSTAIGRRALVENLHFYCGLALPLPVLASLVVPGGASLRRDVRRITRWTNDEVTELVSVGRVGRTYHDKFNPGQKMNALLSTGAIGALFATGLALHFFNVVPVNFRPGVTFVHDVVALCITALLFGHIMMALTHRYALVSMITGKMPRTVAVADNRDWVSEIEAAER